MMYVRSIDSASISTMFVLDVGVVLTVSIGFFFIIEYRCFTIIFVAAQLKCQGLYSNAHVLHSIKTGACANKSNKSLQSIKSPISFQFLECFIPMVVITEA